MSEEQETSPVRRGRPRTKANGSHPTGGVQIEGNESIPMLWQKMELACNNSGPYANASNVLKILAWHEEFIGKIWYDEFHDRIFSKMFGDEHEWCDLDEKRLTSWIQDRLRIPKISKEHVRDAVDQFAALDTRNEPRDWMDALTWDEKPRLDHVMADGFGAPQNDYTAAVGRCWFISMVARIYQPGAKVDTMPVFEGLQGIRKSSGLDAIGGKWFAESHEDINSKDFRQILRGKMLVEFSELHAFKRADIERIKGIITCRIDRYRESYGRHARDYPRRCVFAGTTNRDDWVTDDTGARRFWPVACGEVSVDYLREQRAQLFAEAIHLHRQGTAWWNVDTVLALEEQNKRREDDTWAQPLLDAAKLERYVIVRDLLRNVIGIPLERQDRAIQNRVARILKLAGFNKVQKWVNGVNCKVWVNDQNRPQIGSETNSLF